MKDFLTRAVILFCLLFSLNGIKLYGQQPTSGAGNALNTPPANYTTFTGPDKLLTEEVIANNPGYEYHPEIGMLYSGAPCKDCYELIGSRTENSKTFIKAGTGGRDVMQQTASGSLHYKGPLGNWITIESKLQSGEGKGVFAARQQPVPVEINTAMKFSSLGMGSSLIRFNRNLELVYINPAGTEELLGAADYSHYTAGDNGVFITNAWNGIDIEMHVVRGAIKTNFIINHAMPGYTNGSLLIRDHMNIPVGMHLFIPGENKYKHTGDLEIKDGYGADVYLISAAAAFEKAAGRSTLKLLEYYIAGTDVDIAVPGNFLNRAAASYPVVIDPLVSFATSTTIAGSKYSPGWTSGCVYTNPATVPARVYVTDVQFTFQYIASGGALTNNGAYDFKLGTCRSPAPASLYWNCSSGLPGTCDAIGATMYAGQIAPCLPPPQCTPYDLNLSMDFYQNYASSPGCSPMYISAGTPLTITVFGHTIEASTIASASNICQGESTILTASAIYGVPPYTYSWSPGSGVGATYTVSPTSTTTFTVTATDACGGVSTATKTINVNPVSPISGTTTICAGGASTLICLPPGGTWSSSNTAIASVGSSSGIVTGSGLGLATITYTTAAGCTTTTPVNVIAPVAPIIGYMVVCTGSTSTLSDATPGGTWSSSIPAIGIVGSASGIASGVSSGTTNISYTAYGGGCYATAVLTVNPLAPITGAASVCVGGATTLTDAIGGGAWSSSNTAIATVGSSTGVVNGISAGSATITYLTPAGCRTTISLVVNLLNPITGTLNVCQGSTTSLSDAAAGGAWASSNTTVATVGSSSGTVNGINGGITNITYSIPAGCYTTAIVTVNPIMPVTGTTSVCVGGITPLSDAAGAGTWSSSNTAIATVGSLTGIVTGVSVGSSDITYISAAGCAASASVNVGLPTPITGATSICEGNSAILSNSTTGGIWASANTGVATIGSATGLMTGVSGGTVVISYTTPSGCSVTIPVTINPAPPVTGPSMICVGSSAVLSNSSAGGTWRSSSTGVATIGSITGSATGVSTGTTVISYTTVAGCLSVKTLTVDVPAPITGTPATCQGSTTTLSSATPGGTWSSGNPGVASVGSATGIITGVSGGSVTINYTTAGGCNATVTVTVNPISPITGISTLCTGSTITLNDAATGGTWSSLVPSVAAIGSSTGIVTGASAGTVGIRYTTAAGCMASGVVTVNPSPLPITGSTLVCTSTTLSDAAGGGLWTSSNTAIAVIVSTSGFVTGAGPGTVLITYTLPGGCFTTATLTVDPITAISGTPEVCQGSTTALSYPQPGGVWTSLNTAIATVDGTTGVVTGITGGTVAIKYTTMSGCAATINVTVDPLLPITGTSSVCQGSTTTLNNATPGGGIWSSGSTAIATVGAATGIVSGAAPGTSTINFTTSAGCVAMTEVTVNPLALITGTPFICEGNTTALSDATPGGSWSSLATGIASVGSSTGIASGVSAGTTIINYTTPEGCIASFSITVNALPSAISGSATVCQGNTTTLTNSLPGGTWSSSTSTVATIGSATGIVSGLNAGTTIIDYTTSAGCYTATIVTVNPLSPITGTPAVCVGSTATLNDATPGGSWSSTVSGVATVGSSTGVVSGITSGVTTIQYTTGLGCVASFVETVNPLPSAIGGIPKVCVGSVTVLTNALTGGVWSISNPAVATITASSGIVSGIAPDTVTVTYSSGAGCIATIIVTVNPLPLAITGITSICQGQISLLNDATSGGTWSSSLSSIASVGSATGLVSGLLPGTTNIKYTTPEGCFTLTPFTVNSVPSAITGVPVVCVGSTTALFNSLPAGTWSSNNTTVASIGFSTGIVTGVSAGTTIITYITSAGCFVTATVTVNPTPVITGTLFTDPTTCVNSDGTITLTGLTAGQTFTASYTLITAVSVILTADGSGNVTITGLAAGTYSNFSVTNAFGCTSNIIAGPVTLVLPAAPPAPVAANNTPICEGSPLNLTAADAMPGVTYSWAGPGSFTSTAQNLIMNPSVMSEAGTYTVTATKLGCVSAPATTDVVIHPVPSITAITSSNPNTCRGTDGTVTLWGLAPGVSYIVNYTFNGNPNSATYVADGSGKVIITSLAAGDYAGFFVSSFTCRSNTVGPVALHDPNSPPVPKLFSNSPLCSGKTLSLDATDTFTSLTYEWEGPNGFTSDLRNPQIPDITMADSGLYTLTIKYLNCPTVTSENVIVYPPLKLTYVSPGQVIPLGSSIALKAEGGRFYYWSPNDGSLNDANVDAPVATPQQTTVYLVQAMNVWGCADSAEVTITVDDNIKNGIPNAFTPNGDGKNDVFKPENIKYDRLIDFKVYNRWGQMVYHNSYDINQGWDGTFNGVPQDMGVYDYIIILSEPNGVVRNFKGTVLLAR